MSACPHKKIVARGSNWYCDWCEQRFIPATRESAEAFIKRDNEERENWARINAELDAKHRLEIRSLRTNGIDDYIREGEPTRP